MVRGTGRPSCSAFLMPTVGCGRGAGGRARRRLAEGAGRATGGGERRREGAPATLAPPCCRRTCMMETSTTPARAPMAVCSSGDTVDMVAAWARGACGWVDGRGGGRGQVGAAAGGRRRAPCRWQRSTAELRALQGVAAGMQQRAGAHLHLKGATITSTSRRQASGGLGRSTRASPQPQQRVADGGNCGVQGESGLQHWVVLAPRGPRADGRDALVSLQRCPASLQPISIGLGCLRAPASRPRANAEVDRLEGGRPAGAGQPQDTAGHQTVSCRPSALWQRASPAAAGRASASALL